MNDLVLAPRRGPRPQTTNSLPHSQLDQHGPTEIIRQLHEWCFALPDVSDSASRISVPGARALVLADTAEGNERAFMVGREFAHIHPEPDRGSLHVMLPPEVATQVTRHGWGEDHYLVTQGRFPAGLVLVFSPRDQDELAVVQAIVRRSYEFATHLDSPARGAHDEV